MSKDNRITRVSVTENWSHTGYHATFTRPKKGGRTYRLGDASFKRLANTVYNMVRDKSIEVRPYLTGMGWHASYN